MRKLGNDTKLSYLFAPDMFSEDHKQVFSAKTGKWLQTLKEGQQVAKELDFNVPEQEALTDENQLSLF